MKDFDYIELANRTTSASWNKEVPMEIIHGAIGISGEAGEILDSVKKSLFYNKPLDKENLILEMGDVLWYMALMMKTLNVTFEQVQRLNIKKLSIRYPEDFKDVDAVNKNVDEEMKILRTGEGDYNI